MTTLIISAIASSSAGVAMLIKLHWNSSNLIALFIFTSCSTNGLLVLMICLGGMVAIRSKSKKVLQENKVMQGETQRESKIYRKFWQSCPIIKIKFGAQNFVEELTPLNCLDFTVNLAVQFLLVGG